MNAPWKVNSPSDRTPFAAYVCDETSLDTLRPVVIELGWAPEKCNKGGLRNAIQSLSVSASPASSRAACACSRLTDGKSSRNVFSVSPEAR
mgnify:CR=1 FL=1